MTSSTGHISHRSCVLAGSWWHPGGEPYGRNGTRWTGAHDAFRLPWTESHVSALDGQNGTGWTTRHPTTDQEVAGSSPAGRTSFTYLACSGRASHQAAPSIEPEARGVLRPVDE